MACMNMLPSRGKQEENKEKKTACLSCMGLQILLCSLSIWRCSGASLREDLELHTSSSACRQKAACPQLQVSVHCCAGSMLSEHEQALPR